MLHWFGKRLREMQEVPRDERGFTLIELLVVVIIIGILAAIAIPVFLSQRDNAREAAAESGLRNAATAQQAFYTEAGAYAASATETVEAAGGPTGNTDTLADYGFPTGNDPAVTFGTVTDGSVPRTNAAGVPVVGAGLAAEGTVEDIDGNKGIYDYDSTTYPSAEKFCRKPSSTSSTPCSSTITSDDLNPPGTISYPFNPDAEPDLDFLREEAERQGNYYSTRVNISNSNYPPSSSNQTVFYVNGQGGSVDLNTRYNPAAQGTIVVENGNVSMDGNASFNGVIIVTGNGTSTGAYTSTGTPELEGFVLADGAMTIRGDVTPFSVTEDFTSRPGFYAVRQWSWRECDEPGVGPTNPC